MRLSRGRLKEIEVGQIVVVLGNLLYDSKGNFVRHFSYGYCCSCGGKPKNHCVHIKEIIKR